jgi:hypothetical protein
MRRKPLFPPPVDPQTGKRQRHKGRTAHQLLTVNDWVRVERTCWHCPGQGSSTPADAFLDTAEATISLGVRELACRLNQNARSFDKAADNLARAAQIRLSGERLRQLVEAEGKTVLAAQRSGDLGVGWTAADCRTEPEGPTRVYLGSDGVTVPMVTAAEKQSRRQKVKDKRRRRGRKCRPLPRPKAGADQTYKEFKVVAYYDEDQAHRHVVVTRGDHVAAGRLMRRDAGRIALDKADEKVANVDGADWIRNQLRRQNLPLDAVGLDFYHLADNVHKARRSVFGDEDAGGREWAAGVLHAAKHEGYAALWERLTAWRASLRSPAKRQAADGLLHYVAKREEMIRYPEFQAKGWQIGSGPTEAMCKTTTARIKGSGMRWDADNAEAVMALDALEQSGEWKLYWQTRLQPPG